MDIKEEIKEESSVLDFEREVFIKALVNKAKIETVTSSSDIKPEFENSSMCSHNEEHNQLKFNETIRESGIETEIDIKEEGWRLEREDAFINEDVKDETHEDCYSSKPPSLCKDVTSYTSYLSCTEDLANDIGLNVNKGGSECVNNRKCQRRKSIATDISSLETSVCLATSDDQKIVKAHKCIICNKAFTALSSLKRHKLLHEGIKPHKCNICDKAFTQSSSLKNHKLIHDGTMPHKCNICQKAFTQLSTLKRHKMIHEGSKPYKCNICNKSFTRLSHLKKHKLIHDGIKPHKCNACEKGFIQLSHLRSHKLIHEGIKPHKCNICSKAFTKLSNLKNHKLIHYGTKPHRCDICNKAFIQLSHLNKHKLIHEGIGQHRCHM